ncbi:MAG: AMP-binding protein, partial [Caulobacteraceae bacterium]
VEIGPEGHITILGRAKRFAKVAGEMVSLAAVEEMVAGLWPGERHAVVAVNDPRKGERLILVTEFKDAETGPLLAYAKEIGAPEIAVPRKVFKVNELPVLGTGKTDYVAIQRIAEAEVAGETRKEKKA